MRRVAVSGAAGKMGRLACAAVAAAEDLELAAAYAPGHEGETIEGMPVVVDADEVQADVVVELTNPDVVMGNLAAWQAGGAHAVVGTSGFDAARIAEVESLFASGPPNCLIVPNFSVGAVVMMKVAVEIARHFEAVEIVETHHASKPDAPSGTAIATAERLSAAGAAGVGGDQPSRGERRGDVPVHSVRLPGAKAHQEVVFGNPGETLRIRHDTSDYASFMPGVLLAVRAVGSLPGVNVGLEQLLG